MKLDFIGDEIRDNDELWIIKGDLARVQAYREGDYVYPVEENQCLAQKLKDGKNSRIDLRRSWLDNFMMKYEK